MSFAEGTENIITLSIQAEYNNACKQFQKMAQINRRENKIAR